MSTEEEKLHEFLREIQLEQFFYLVVRNLHVTRLAHFDHVEEIDLTGIGMSKPEQRRLFDHLKKAKKPSLKKFFRKSFRKDSEKRRSISPPKETSISVDESCGEALSMNDPVNAARNSIQQGLKCLIQQKDLVLGDFLGKGAFGYVCKGVWTTDKGAQVNVAVKCLKQSQDEATVMLQGEFIKEANAMSKLDHPNLIRLYGIVLTTPMMLVTELAPVGSLLNRLRKEPHKFMISILCSFVVQIVSGMKYLEMNRFIHRDLAARNILLVSYEKIKIGDFGLMRALPSDTDYYVMQPTGLVPFAWCATECLKYRRFSHASDVWAFGVTILEMFSYGQEPWPGLSGAGILERIDAPNFLRPDRPDHCPVEIYKIMKHHCWNHIPEERSSFETLEKMILKVLPKETNAMIDHYPLQNGELSFKKGDPLTIIEASRDPSLVKAQNRRNGKVGCIPVNLLSSTGALSPDAKPRHLSPDISKVGKVPHSDHGMHLEPDSFSVVSRVSSSSSGSNSSSEYPSSRHTPGIAHSNPQDIPSRVKRHSSASSGIGSGGPSFPNSYKEEFMLPSVSESDYGSQDDSVSLSSKKSTTLRGVAEDRISHSSYENTVISRHSVSPQNQIIESPPLDHSNPIVVPKQGYEIPRVFAISQVPNISANHHLHIVSLPCHKYEKNQNIHGCSLLSEAEHENVTLPCSAPTTKSELKSARCIERKLEVDHAGELSPTSSFGTSVTSAHQREGSVASPVCRLVDNVIYESMLGRQEYESMNDQTFSHKETNVKNSYENVRISNNTVIISGSESTSYENVVIGPKVCKKDEDIPPPILPRKNQNMSENEVPLPPRTYRNLAKPTSLSLGAPPVRVNIYENSTIEVLPGVNSDFEMCMKLPPKSYKRHENCYENADFRCKLSPSSSPSYENCKLHCGSSSGLMSVGFPRESENNNVQYENVCDNIKLNGSDASPPPLPKKKSNKYSRALSSSASREEDSSLPSLPALGPAAIEETAGSSVEISTVITNTFQTRSPENEEHSSEKSISIEHSSHQEKLPCKAEECFRISCTGKEPLQNQNTRCDLDVSCEKLKPVSESSASTSKDGNKVAYKDFARHTSVENSDLLRALLSPIGRRSPVLARTQSEECPVPPPRKRRDKSKSCRRHTVGTLSAEHAAKLGHETLIESCADQKGEVTVTEGSNLAVAEDQSFTRTSDVTFESQRLESISCNKENIDPLEAPLPSRIASDMALKREDSDFVDIEVEDAKLDDDTVRSSDSSTFIVASSAKEEKLSLIESNPDSYEGRLVDEGSSDISKPETVKTGFSKIKSLLSGKTSVEKRSSNMNLRMIATMNNIIDKLEENNQVSSVDDNALIPAEISKNPAEGRMNGSSESSIDNQVESGGDQEETRYVLHFVTPV